jgi:hypothetical protein
MIVVISALCFVENNAFPGSLTEDKDRDVRVYQTDGSEYEVEVGVASPNWHMSNEEAVAVRDGGCVGNRQQQYQNDQVGAVLTEWCSLCRAG